MPLAKVQFVSRRAVLTTLAASLAMPAQAAEPIVVQGSTTFNARIMEPLKDVVRERLAYPITVVPNRSLHGLVALLEGRAALAMLSAPLEPELAYLRRQFPAAPLDTLQIFEIARTSVAFIVHETNPIRRLALEDIRRILTGELLNWNEIGGPNLAIKPVFIREGGGVIVTVQSQLMRGSSIQAPAAMRFERAKQVPKVVAQEPGAIGIAQMQVARESGLPILETDQPIEQRLTLVSLGTPTAKQKELIELLRSLASERLF